MNQPPLHRRRWLQLCAAASLAPHASAFAQASAKDTERPLVVAQLADMAPGRARPDLHSAGMTVEQRRQAGRATRKTMPRSALGDFRPRQHRQAGAEPN